VGRSERIAAEQAALRRVATLVASGAPSETVFAAVAAEVGRLLDVELSLLTRYDPPQGAAAVVGAWGSTAGVTQVTVGSRLELGGRNVVSLVVETGRPARITDYRDATGAVAETARGYGIRSAVGVPISVDGRVWGVINVASTQESPLPPDTEVRLAGFTELVATAIANAQARLDLRGFAEEQASLRRVATLVARGAPPEKLFAAVAAEVGQLLEADVTILSRHEPDGTQVSLGVWRRTGEVQPFPVGTRMVLGGRNATTLVVNTGRPARIDTYADGPGPIGVAARGWLFRSGVGVPINVEGRLWGVMAVASMREEPLPPDTEARLAGFTELVATAIANADAQVALTASRARIVLAADQARRQIERNLHDGAQQRLVSITLQLQAVRGAVPPGADELAAQLDNLVAEASSAQSELRELARGIHPAFLAERGLPSALRTLARRSAVPVRLDVRVERRFPEPIEIAVYYLVAESLTNAVKYAQASTAGIAVDTAAAADGCEVLEVRVVDDGRGGADLGGGSGLLGLKDRVEALGGRLQVQSPLGEGTSVLAELPLPAGGSCRTS
jgi:signal transduction histidine kinase